MTEAEKILRIVFSLVLVGCSVLLVGDGFRLIAEWRVGPLNGIFMLLAGALGALVFAFRAADAADRWPASITKGN